MTPILQVTDICVAMGCIGATLPGLVLAMQSGIPTTLTIHIEPMQLLPKAAA